MKSIQKEFVALIAAAFLGLIAGAQSALAQPSKPGIERFYVLYCGDIELNDMGRFSPGYSGPGALSVTCYLIKHSQGWLLWDTGLGDAIVVHARRPEEQRGCLAGQEDACLAARRDRREALRHQLPCACRTPMATTSAT